MSSQAHANTAIPVLTAIHDPVSRRVADYFAQRPYPDDLTIPAVLEAMPPSQLIKSFNSWADVTPQSWEAAPEILVAGCGTGDAAFIAAQTYPHARVLGVDISMPRLALAQLRHRDSGLPGIAFAQADILELPSTGRRFDVIETCKVLDHLADPWTGFAALVSVLRKGGFMRVALRRAHRGALFSPHENAVTIAHIADNLAAHNLRFLGFCFSSPEVRETFRRSGRTRDDDLQAWAGFESEQPLALVSTYDFWVQAV